MSVVAFRPFVTVRVEEKDTKVPITALIFTPTAETTRRLANHRLVFRSRHNGFQLYAQHPEEAGAGPIAPVARPTPMHFGIVLTDRAFLARYHPALTKETGPSLRLSNVGDGDVIRSDGVLHHGESVGAADGVRIVPSRPPIQPGEPEPPGPPQLVDDELAGRGVFGALELIAAPIADPVPDGGWQYLVAFKRRA